MAHQEKAKGKKGEVRKNMMKENNKKEEKKKKKKGRDFPYESSLGGIRLMTSPCIRARQELSKRILDRVGNAYEFSKSYFT